MNQTHEKFDQALRAAVTDTVENMAFTSILYDEKGAELQSEETLSVSLLIHDPVQGELRLRMPRSLLLKISESIYTLPEEELTDAILKDTLGEIINTIAGRFMNDILPNEQAYQLGLPEEELEEPDPEMILKQWHFRAEEESFSVLAIGQTLLLLQ